MKPNPKFNSWLGGLLSFAGVLIGLSLSAAVTWGPVEASLYTSFNADSRFAVKCPLMLSQDESGVIRAKITNFTDETVTPVVYVEISHANAPRRLDETVALSPRESKLIEWSVDPSDVVFERLILVNILQARYRENPSFLGSCGILVFSLFGLTGMQTFFLVMSLSLAAMGFGATRWWRAKQPLDEASLSLARIGGFLIGITVLAFLSALLRIWGLTILLDALILLVVGIMVTDFGLFPQNRKG